MKRPLFITALLGCATLLALGTTLPPPPNKQLVPGVLVLKGRVIDGTGAAPIEHGVVVIANGQVQCVGTVGKCAYPANAPVIDAGTDTILPGLIDLHVHARPTYFSWFLPTCASTRHLRGASTNWAA